MWSEQLTNMLLLMVMASLLRASYELSRQRSLGVEQDTDRPLFAATNPEGAELAPWQKEWAEKAVKRYAEAQEKKWRRWNEAMFERT